LHDGHDLGLRRPRERVGCPESSLEGQKGCHDLLGPRALQEDLGYQGVKGVLLGAPGVGDVMLAAPPLQDAARRVEFSAYSRCWMTYEKVSPFRHLTTLSAISRTSGTTTEFPNCL